VLSDTFSRAATSRTVSNRGSCATAVIAADYRRAVAPFLQFCDQPTASSTQADA
jgi:hypothetical protein